MQLHQSLVLAAIATGASAQVRDAKPLMARQTSEQPQAPTQSIPSECDSLVYAVGTAIPTPPPELQTVENIQSYILATDASTLCAATTGLPASVTSAFASYNSDLYSYLSSGSSNFFAMASTCSGSSPVLTSAVAGYSSLLSLYSSYVEGSACSGGAAVATSTSVNAAPTTTDPTTSSDGSSAAPSQTTTQETSSVPTSNGGPKETGMVAAAAVLMGVAALL